MFGVFQEDVFRVTLRKFPCSCCYCSMAAINTAVSDCVCYTPLAAAINSLACVTWNSVATGDINVTSGLTFAVITPPRWSWSYCLGSLLLPSRQCDFSVHTSFFSCFSSSLLLFNVNPLSSIPWHSGQFSNQVLLLCDTWMDGEVHVPGVEEEGWELELNLNLKYQGIQRRFNPLGWVFKIQQREHFKFMKL